MHNTQAKLRGIRLPVPPSVEQHRIVEELERQFSFVEACEAVVESELARSIALRRSVLKSAFEGRLVP
jgi:type I restriction enzyme S subunit